MRAGRVAGSVTGNRKYTVRPPTLTFWKPLPDPLRKKYRPRLEIQKTKWGVGRCTLENPGQPGNQKTRIFLTVYTISIPPCAGTRVHRPTPHTPGRSRAGFTFTASPPCPFKIVFATSLIGMDVKTHDSTTH